MTFIFAIYCITFSIADAQNISPSSIPPGVTGCNDKFLNLPGTIDILNKNIGSEGFIPKKITSISNAVAANQAVLELFDIPLDSPDGPRMSYCHVNLHFIDESSESGTFVKFPADAGGASQILWFSDLFTERARDQQRQKRAQQQISYSNNLQACYALWKIATIAKALLTSGMTEQQVVEHLSEENAYGPNGEVYRDSQGAQQMIEEVVAATAMSPSDRIAANLPDFGSQQFMSECPQRAAQASK